jgi:hypothetical protein
VMADKKNFCVDWGALQNAVQFMHDSCVGHTPRVDVYALAV